MWWTGIVGKLFGGVTSYFTSKLEHKQKIKQKQLDLEVAKITSEINRVEKQQDSDNDIDRITIGERGWKDDIITYTLISPFIILMFNPLLALIFNYDPLLITTAMKDGFDAMNDIPEPLWYGLLIVFSDVFGLRSFMRTIFTSIAAKMVKKLP
jgi:hypothetical protein